MRALLLICVVLSGCDDDRVAPDLAAPLDLAVAPDLAVSCSGGSCGGACTPAAAGAFPKTWDDVLAGGACSMNLFDCQGQHCVVFEALVATVTLCFDASGALARFHETNYHASITTETCVCGDGLPDPVLCSCTPMGPAPCPIDGGGTD